MIIYVASSWRNIYQPDVVIALRQQGHTVYDFRNPPNPRGGFAWSEIDPEWETWKHDISRYVAGLDHPRANDGFTSDMDALKTCDCCVLVAPTGVSASLEFGFAVGAGKTTIAYLPEIREPELMFKMADYIVTRLHDLLEITELTRS